MKNLDLFNDGAVVDFVVVRNTFPTYCSGLSKGAPGKHTLSRSKFFHFHAVFGKNCAKWKGPPLVPPCFSHCIDDDNTRYQGGKNHFGGSLAPTSPRMVIISPYVKLSISPCVVPIQKKFGQKPSLKPIWYLYESLKMVFLYNRSKDSIRMSHGDNGILEDITRYCN